ncbi:hypothetical protein Tcan_02268 [Toxocara canis]|uniref:Uncharacterized protein n=1 Tax=Toxocara canis TaxID=6265 RepID=A0A0B2UPW0_TOXCA|nr:hypothetical protein Tcan_02268 [Toxocara canis]
MNDEYIAHASADTSFGGHSGDNAPPTLKEQSELDAEQKELSMHDMSEVESLSNQTLTSISPQAGNPTTILPIEEVLSSTAAEEITLKDNQSEETPRDGAIHETLSSSALQKVVLEDGQSDGISKDDAVHEVCF